MQHGKVVVYASIQLNVHEKYYLTHVLELVDVVFDLKIWRHYLYGVHVDVYTHHKIVEMCLLKNKLHLFQRILFDLLKDYDMLILKDSSKANVGADALSHMSMDSMTHVEEG